MRFAKHVGMTSTKRAFPFLSVLCLVPLSLLSPAARAMEVKELKDTHFMFSGPVTWIAGEAFWGGYLTVVQKIAERTYFGGETGFMVWSDSGADGSVAKTEWVLPMLPTILYEFEMREAAGFHPFLGLGLGAALVHASVDLGGGIGVSGTEFEFEGLAHLGATFGSSETAFLDLRLGLVKDEFAIGPTIGIRF